MHTNLETLQQEEKKYLCSTYGRYPLAIKSARGYTLTDYQDREYIDLLAGISVCNLGHCHPEISRAICGQAEKLVHTSNLFFQKEQLDLARELLSTCGLDKAFFCNSGAEANEGAIKTVRRYMRMVRENNRFEIITLKNSFHGRTMATLSATGQEKIKQGFDPLLPGFVHAEPNDGPELKSLCTEKTAAIMLEVIQGEGGVVPLQKDYLHFVSKLCAEKGLLLIIDEVQTGMGRTGRFWAHEHFGLNPDIITSAKALAAGLPMGAMMLKDEVARALDPGSHATTFGGSPLVCAAALKTLEIMKRDNVVQMSAETGEYAREILNRVRERSGGMIEEIRGMGLMLGVKLSFPGKRVWQKLLERGFVLNLTQESVLRLLPPLNIPREQLDDFAAALEKILEEEKKAGQS
jgi:acetylornithine aminotransferase